MLVEFEPESLKHEKKIREKVSRCVRSIDNAGRVFASLIIISHGSPNARKAILVERLETDLQELLEDLAEELKCTVLALEMRPDHVHPFLNCPPVLAPDQMMFRLKGATSRILRERYQV